MPVYSEFKKQAWGVLGTEGDFSAGLPKPTPEQKAHNDAFNEGFLEGAAGALAGDGYRAFARGVLEEGADTLDAYRKAPGNLLFSMPMLAGKINTRVTGDASKEQALREMREAFNNTLTFPGYFITKGMRALAKNKGLDPKWLTQEAYDASKLGGKGFVWGADAALLSKAAPAPVRDVAGKLTTAVIADALGSGTTHVGEAILDTVQEAKAEAKRQASHDAMVDYFKKKTERPAGPIVVWSPKLKDTLWNQIAVQEAAKDPEGADILDQIDADREKLDYEKALKQLKQLGKQTAGAGVGGAVGLATAHQITKRIPYLKKRKMLRYLINMIGAGGIGYAGWKLMGK